MSTILDTVPETVAERFETVLPDGSVFSAFIDARGRTVYMPGHVEPTVFAQEVDALIAVATAAGLIDETAQVYGCTVQPSGVRTRYALPTIDDDGELSLDWNTGEDWHQVDAWDAGAVPVTYYEF